MAQTSGIAETGVANPAQGEDVGEDEIMQPALNPGQSSASGNPGANNPGVAPMGTGASGVATGDTGRQGFTNSDNLSNTGAASVMGAGGMGGTGLIGRQPTSEDDAARILGGDPTSPALGSPPENTRDVPAETQPGATDIAPGAGAGLASGERLAAGTGSGQPENLSGNAGSSR